MFPFNQRWLMALWNLFNFSEGRFVPDPKKSAEFNRGAYLVEGLAHCGECHTPRNRLGASDKNNLLAGTPVGPDGGKVPNITPDQNTGLGRWSAKDVVRVLESGLLPNFDAVGSSMGEVVRATSKLEPSDRAAIAAYLATIPPIANPKAPATQPGF